MKKKPVTVFGTKGSHFTTRRYTVRDGICHMPKTILAAMAVRRMFEGPDYWTHAIAHDGTRLGVKAFVGGSERGIAHKDYTSHEQIELELEL